MADITPKKRIRFVTLSEHWEYTQTAIANCKKYARKTSFDLQQGPATFFALWIGFSLAFYFSDRPSIK